jgi:hypothetical protein
MKYIISRYNQDISWLKDYTDDYVLYDRSEKPEENSIIVPNIGSDIYDKLTFIIDNYKNLPDVAVYTKANLFKYITREEFDKIKDNKTFTPIFSKFHEEKTIDLGESRDFLINLIEGSPISQEFKDLWYKFNLISPTEKKSSPDVRKFAFYDNEGMYNEINIAFFMQIYIGREEEDLLRIKEIKELMGFLDREYVQFAPGSNYILPKENILKQPRETYVKLRSFLINALYKNSFYPREAMLIERGLYYLWR